MKAAAIILAAGSGKRMGTAEKKQYIDLEGHPILYYSLNAFEKSQIHEIVLVVSPEDVGAVQKEYMNREFSKLSCVVASVLPPLLS